VRKFEPANQGGRERNCVKTRIQHPECRIQNETGAGRREGDSSDRAEGARWKHWMWEEAANPESFRGRSRLEPSWETGGLVICGTRRYVTTGFYRVVTASCRVEFGFLPLLAAYYRILPHSVFWQAKLASNIRRGKPPRHGGTERSMKLCGISCGFSREVSRSYAKVRTDQGRGYAMLRIFTGGTLF
jgi:hypothetical protein